MTHLQPEPKIKVQLKQFYWGKEQTWLGLTFCEASSKLVAIKKLNQDNFLFFSFSFFLLVTHICTVITLIHELQSISWVRLDWCLLLHKIVTGFVFFTTLSLQISFQRAPKYSNNLTTASIQSRGIHKENLSQGITTGQKLQSFKSTEN